MFLGIEVGRHAAFDLAVLPHAAPQRHALQVAAQRVAPLVIRADELLHPTAVALAAELHAAVRAHVLEAVQRAIGRAAQNHRALTHHGALEVARVGHLGLQADVAPVALVEEAFQLLAVQRLVGVDGEGDAAGVAGRP